MNERKIFARGESRNALLIHIKPAGQCPAGLPSHAQEIYKEAFNSAWDQYDRPGERRGDSSR